MKRFSKSRLRLIFFAFFFCLATPAIMLSWKAYEQLRWEVLLQYQQEAEVLTKAIDLSLTQAIAREEAKTDSDYSFLVVTGDRQKGYLQPSPLSKYPVESELPGVIGYFQVESQGDFSTPLLPKDNTANPSYGIQLENFLMRQKLAAEIKAILLENELVAEPSKALSQQMADKNSDISSEASTLDEIEANEAEAERSLLDEQASEEKIVVTGSRIKRQVGSEKSELDTAGANKGETADSSGKSVYGGFNRLQSEAVQSQISEDLTRNRQLAELSSAKKELQSKQEKSALAVQEDAEKLKKQKLEKRANKRSNRFEQNYIAKKPVAQAVKKDSSKGAQPASAAVEPQANTQQLKANPPPVLESRLDVDNQSIQISLFQSEVEPFRFSLLSSGHLVAYRQVWREQQRVVQGVLLDTSAFFKRAIRSPWFESSLSDVSTLHIGYAKSLIKSYTKNSEVVYTSRRQSPLNGRQIYSSQLSEPFAQISLVYSVNKMPIGAGANFIIMLALSLLAVITAGSYLSYRIALRHTNLAKQQQNFVSSVSHELKTPLTSIRMYGEILKQGWMDEAKKQEYYDYIYNESERLSRLISNILQISKVDRNALSLSLKPVGVSELTDMVKSKVDHLLSQSGFELTISLAENCKQVKVDVDSDAFVQIMINLIDNSIKYAAKVKSKFIELNVSRDEKDMVTFSLRDFGPGISPKLNKKVFELFYRVGNEMTREHQGTGIGLALVKQLVSALGGNIKVVDAKPGAKFIFSLPVSKKE